MTIWTERYETHAAWSEVARARATINDLRIDPGDGPSNEALVYVGAVIELLERRHTESDPLEVTPAMLAVVHSQVSSWNQHLDQASAEAIALSEVVGATDSVIDSLASWPPLKPAKYLSGIQSSIDSFATKSSAALEGVADRVESLGDRLDALQEEESNVTASVETERQRISEAIATFSTDSKTTVTSALEAQEIAIRERLDQWTHEDISHRAAAQETLDQLKRHEDTARKTVHATTAWTVATDYGKYARNKAVSAWLCDIAAAIVGAAGVGAILWHLFTMDASADANIGLSLTRLAASLGALGVAALLGRRGAQHHRESRAAKRTDLALRKVGPFIADLPEDEQQLIIEEFTDRVFIRGELDGPQTGARPALVQLIGDMRKRKAEEAKAAEKV